MDTQTTEGGSSDILIADESQFFSGTKVLGASFLGFGCEEFQSGRESVDEFRVIIRNVYKAAEGVELGFPLPVTQKRSCEKRLIAQFCVSDDLDAAIKQNIKECIIAGISSGVLATIIAGPEAFLPVLDNAVKLCLITKGIELGVGGLKLGLRTESSCSDWRDV